MNKRCVAVDFDGTLAHYDGWKGPGVYGEPIQPMVEKVKALLAEGHEAWIFTARLAGLEMDEYQAEYHYITNWLNAAGLPSLPMTCIKLKRFTEFWDDRAVRIIRNTGEFA